MIEVRLGSDEGCLGVVEDEAGVVSSRRRLADLVGGQLRHDRSRGRGMLLGPTHEAGITGHQPSGQLAARIGQLLIHQQDVVVASLLEGTLGRSTRIAALLHLRAQGRQARSCLRLRSYGLKQRFRSGQGASLLLRSGKRRPSCRELLRDATGALLRRGTSLLELRDRGCLIRHCRTVRRELVLDHHEVGKLSDRRACPGGRNGQLLPAHPAQVIGRRALGRTGVHDCHA